MPAYSSMQDHMAALGLSHDTSEDRETTYMEGRRSIERTQVRPPRQNTTMRMTFCRLGNGNALSGAIGRRVVSMSVKIVPPAMVYLSQSSATLPSIGHWPSHHIANRSRHCPVPGVQKALTGEHMNMVAKNPNMVTAIFNPMTTKHPMRHFLVVKKRRYWNKMDIFIVPSPRAYIHTDAQNHLRDSTMS